MKYADMVRAKLLVAMPGGNITVSDQDGEILWQFGLMPGVYDIGQYEQLLPRDCEIDFDQTVTVLTVKGHTMKPIGYGAGAAESGANHDWRPTIYSEAEKRMFATLEQVNKKSKALEKRMKTVMRMEEEGKKTVNDELIDDEKQIDETKPEATKTDEQTVNETETKKEEV